MNGATAPMLDACVMLFPSSVVREKFLPELLARTPCPNRSNRLNRPHPLVFFRTARAALHVTFLDAACPTAHLLVSGWYLPR